MVSIIVYQVCVSVSFSTFTYYPLCNKVLWSGILTEEDGLTAHTSLHKHFLSFLRWEYSHVCMATPACAGSTMISICLFYLQLEWYQSKLTPCVVAHLQSTMALFPYEYGMGLFYKPITTWRGFWIFNSWIYIVHLMFIYFQDSIYDRTSLKHEKLW